MDKKLSQWAKENQLNYHTAYQQFKRGTLPISAYKSSTGQILIGEQPVAVTTVVASEGSFLEPLNIDIATASETSTRTNKAHRIRPTDRYNHISDAISPFSKTSLYGGTGDVTIRDAAILCQQAYYGFSIFRSTIDLLTDFSVGKIFFKDGTKKNKQFFESYFKEINLHNLMAMWFREYYRSGNIFIWRIEGKLKDNDVRNLTKTFGLQNSIAADIRLPIRYVICNPADIIAQGNISFANSSYSKILTDYELERLKNPRTDQDRDVLNSLPDEIRTQIQNKRNTSVSIPLDPSILIANFYRRQSYESFAVPMAYPVLEDLNAKKELKLMDQAIARTAQQAILHISMGTELKDGRIHIDQKAKVALQKIFENESVGRVLITDWTVEAKFVLPQISDILDPKKYEILDKDIALGLSNILFVQGEKFSNQHAKVELFIEQIKQNREEFLTEFLVPEMKRMAKNLGLRGIPEPEFEEIDLKNELEYAKLYARLSEIGVLTPSEAIDAIETGKLPSKDISVENQKELKTLKDDDLYSPLTMKKGVPNGAGRPSGTSAPQTTKKISPIGGAEKAFSFAKIKENLLLATELHNKVKQVIQKKHNLKKLNADQSEICDSISEIVMANEINKDWLSKAEEYVDSPNDKNCERINLINALCQEKGINVYLGAILLDS